MNEELPYKALRPADYEANRPLRVTEDSMDTTTTYNFISVIDEASIVEFQTRLAQIIPGKLGRASLVLCLLEPDRTNAFAVLSATSQDGIIIPISRRLFHPRVGNIGNSTEGYLLDGTEIEPASTLSTPESLEGLALPDDWYTQSAHTRPIDTVHVASR